MTFAQPEMLWLLAVTLPLLVWFLWWAWRKKQKLIREFVQSRLLAQLTVGVSARRQKLRLALLAAAVACILLALARPQLGFAWEEVRQRGLDILVAIDTSRSMLATDLAPNRLTRAKLAALDLMRSARADRLGLIAFAGTAFLQCPLTLDDNAFSESVNYLDVATLPQGGTALAQAIDTALRTFKESGDNYKVLVLFTDGEDHEAGLEEAGKRAAEAGVRIFPVGIGTFEGERLRVVDEGGKTSYLSDLDGKPVVSKLNMDVLQSLAQQTKGDALKLGGADPMKLLYEARLAPLPRGEHASRLFRQYYERFQWPLGLAILLLAAEMLVHERRRVPRSEAITNAPNADLRKVVALILCLLAPFAAHASAHQAQHAYEAGKFPEAQREYQRLLQKQPNDPRLQYNAGTAAYRAGQYDQAVAALGSAVLSSDPALLARAYYNLANARFRLGEQSPSPTNTLAQWEEAVRHYDSSLKLGPKDADAQFNRDLVAKKIEELRKQQQQQQQQESNQDQQKDDQKDQKDQKDPKDQKDQQQQQSKPSPEDQKQQDPQSQQKRQPDSPDQQPPQPKPDSAQPPKPDPKPEAGTKPDPARKPKSPESGEAQPKPRNEQPPDGQGPAAPAAQANALQMTPEQARQLLEAARSEERPLIFVPPEARRAQPGSRKEW